MAEPLILIGAMGLMFVAGFLAGYGIRHHLPSDLQIRAAKRLKTLKYRGLK